MNFNRKTVAVTGAGGGIGRQLVLQLLQKGASVAAIDINTEALEETRKAAGNKQDRVSVHTADITNRDAVCALPDEIVRHHGQIDALINNAGIIQPFVPFSELDYDTMQRIININLFGMMFMTRSFMSYLASRPEAYIANVSSMGGFLPVPGQTLYGASKAGVKLLTEGLRAELSKSNIGVSVIMPGGIATDIVKNSGVEESVDTTDASESSMKLTTPEEAASVILSGIEKNKPRIIVGKDAAFLDIFSRIAPLRAGKFISKMMKSTHAETFSDPQRLQQRGCLNE